MKILRVCRLFSKKGVDEMVDKIVEKLDKNGIYDYEVSDKIQKDVISIGTDLNNLKIYIPLDYEYSQYDIDDFIRDQIPFSRPVTLLDRNIYVMKITNKVTIDQYYKIVKFIIENDEFCSIIKEN